MGCDAGAASTRPATVPNSWRRRAGSYLGRSFRASTQVQLVNESLGGALAIEKLLLNVPFFSLRHVGFCQYRDRCHWRATDCSNRGHLVGTIVKRTAAMTGSCRSA